MKNLSINLTVVFTFFAVLVFGFTASNGQILADEVRPFDFSDEYYKANGISAELLQDRRNGEDRRSVFDTPTDMTTFRDVRIIETMPGYATEGNVIFWNLYAIATESSFTDNDTGIKARQIAQNHPIYRFPSTSVPGSDRQAALFAIGGRYFEINPIGIGQVINVVFRERITPGAQKTLNMLAERNGRSVDGTPIIRTENELKGLVANGIVSVQKDATSPYLVAKIIQFPERGGITPDAFLNYVREPNGNPLFAETHFVTKFECLKGGGECL